MQIRNVATIAGNIATASPIGDNLPLLLALDSKIVLQGIKKTKILPINDFFINYRKTKLKEGQFIHSIRIPIFDKNILHHDMSLNLKKLLKRILIQNYLVEVQIYL